ncbi:MAG: iron hydrogenase small subunit, partial [Acholeplasmataceae bacterium]|nr:iron hydrogenase small subunit [Acholeplasmataceae bacterium]
GVAIKTFLEHLKKTDKPYHFVEFMGCIGGCINGGGQPIVKARDRQKTDLIKARASVLYKMDERSVVRKSHLNMSVRRLYDEYLDDLGKEGIHDLLHTHYHARKPYSR